MKSHQRDTGYSWVILMSTFVVSFFHLGYPKVFGVFIPYLVEQLDMSTWSVGMVCSLGIGLKGVFGLLWARLTVISTHRTVTITGGIITCLGLICVSLSRNKTHLGCSMVLTSIGYGLPIVSKVTILTEYFETKFSLANGVMFTGGAIGMICLPLISEFVIQRCGWRGAMFIFAATNLNICVAGALMRQPQMKSYCYRPDDNHKNEKRAFNKSSKSDKEGNCQYMFKILASYCGVSVLAQYPILIVYLSSMVLHEVVSTGWILFLVSYTNAQGFSIETASSLSSLGGAGSLAGRIMLGPFIDAGYISARMMFFWLAVGGALAMCTYPFVSTYWMLAVVSFFAGFFLTSTSPVFVIMLKDETNDDSDGFVRAVGLHFMTKGIGMITGGPFTGMLHDITGSFYVAFLSLGLLEATAAILALGSTFVCKSYKLGERTSLLRVTQKSYSQQSV